jgi:hypothetical protein
LGQVLPLDAGVQYEQDPAQHLAVIEPAAARSAWVAWRGLGKQGFDALPQPVRDDPRLLLAPSRSRRS